MGFFSSPDNKNAVMPSLNPLLASMNTMNDKSVLSMLPNFDDPVEQSLASLEQIACKLHELAHRLCGDCLRKFECVFFRSFRLR